MIDANAVRKYAGDVYAKPALARHDQFSIEVRAVEADLRKRGLERNRFPLICSALRSKKFQRDNGIVLDRWEGPASGQSNTVVYHYRRADETSEKNGSLSTESATARALRAADESQGIIRDEIASFGGVEAFIRWVRSDEAGA